MINKHKYNGENDYFFIFSYISRRKPPLLCFHTNSADSSSALHTLSAIMQYHTSRRPMCHIWTVKKQKMVENGHNVVNTLLNGLIMVFLRLFIG